MTTHNDRVIENRLHLQTQDIEAWGIDPEGQRCARRQIKRRERLLGEFAALNGIRYTQAVEFTPTALAAGKGVGVGRHPEDLDWPARDHCSYFCRNRRPVAIVTEPYPSPELGKLHDVLRQRGLVLQTPPNPFASFWCPGATLFIVITRADFGPVNWLRDQLEHTHINFGPVSERDALLREVLDALSGSSALTERTRA